MVANNVRLKVLAANMFAATRAPSRAVRRLTPVHHPAGAAAAEANWLIMNGQFDKGAVKLANIISRHRDAKGPIYTLSSVLPALSSRSLRLVRDLIAPALEGVSRPRDITRMSFPLLCLGVEIHFELGDERAIEMFEHVYLPFFRENELHFNDCEKLFFWHVPKCGGTSFVHHVAGLFYRSGYNYIPNYAFPKFHRAIMKGGHDVFPFLSSSHMPLSLLQEEEVSARRQFLLWRPPVERALSAWRQYNSGSLKRLWLLPQHGAVWRFFPVSELGAWARRAPHSVVNAFEHTFGGSVERAELVDHVLPLSDIERAFELVEEVCGKRLMERGSLRRNVTDKSVVPSQKALQILEEACADDRRFVGQITRCQIRGL